MHLFPGILFSQLYSPSYVGLGITGCYAYMREPFADAPFVHPFRQPSFHAQQLRAMNFAKVGGLRVLWVRAVDRLLQREKRANTEKEALREENWLQYHDRYTGGLPGLFPLILDLPIRFAEAPRDGYEQGVFKNSRGWIRGWKLDDEEQDLFKRGSDKLE